MHSRDCPISKVRIQRASFACKYNVHAYARKVKGPSGTMELWHQSSKQSYCLTCSRILFLDLDFDSNATDCDVAQLEIALCNIVTKLVEHRSSLRKTKRLSYDVSENPVSWQGEYEHLIFIDARFAFYLAWAERNQVSAMTFVYPKWGTRGLNFWLFKWETGFQDVARNTSQIHDLHFKASPLILSRWAHMHRLQAYYST